MALRGGDQWGVCPGPRVRLTAGATVPTMDEGSPIAYGVLDSGVPVYSSDGEEVATVDHVVAAPAQDIFHGLVVRTRDGNRFIAAEHVGSLHERGVDLRIDAAAAHGLPTPEGGAPAMHVHEPGIKPTRWRHVLEMLEGFSSTHRDWRDEDRGR